MAKNRLTPLKDEPTTSFDELISKIDNLAGLINQQNGYLRVIAQKDGFDSEYNFLRHQFNATSAIHEALVKYLKENKAKIVVDGEENNKLAKAEELLNKYQALLTEAMEIIKNRNTATSPVTTVVIHEPLPTEMVSVWFVSVFLTCIMAVDNARMHQMYHAILIHSGI